MRRAAGGLWIRWDWRANSAGASRCARSYGFQRVHLREADADVEHELVFVSRDPERDSLLSRSAPSVRLFRDHCLRWATYMEVRCVCVCVCVGGGGGGRGGWGVGWGGGVVKKGVGGW